MRPHQANSGALLGLVACLASFCGCTASYHAVTATGLDRPYHSMACRLRGEQPPPLDDQGLIAPPLPRFHPVPTRPVFLPDDAPIDLPLPQPPLQPRFDTPPPPEREIPARRSPPRDDPSDLVAEEPGQWRSVKRSDAR
jgi:hypothetical protein